jgi:DNA-binding beta-propeller fold protein YncE
MSTRVTVAILLTILAYPMLVSADEKPYITTQTSLTLLSANDGETDPLWRKTKDGLIDRNAKTKDSFTVIRLGPDDPPTATTVYGTVPCTLIGTPTMAMSADGRFGLITNHDFRPAGLIALQYPRNAPLTNDDIDTSDLSKQELAPPLSNMISMIDLASPDLKVVDRVLFRDQPMHVLAHPDQAHFVVGASLNFYVYKIEKEKLIEVSRSPHKHGPPCFWINPTGDRIIATHGDTSQPATIHWYSFSPGKVKHLNEVEVLPGVDTQLLDLTAIVRISIDGKKALVCQRAGGDFGSLCDVLVVDLTLDPPVISGVIKQVGDGVESFAFHRNGKMAVVTCCAKLNNSIAVIDIESNPARVLYYLDTGGIAQGIEFTPEGDKLFVGSSFTNRIEVFDVVGDFELRKSQKFLKTGHGHCSLTIGRTCRTSRD